MRAGGVDIKPSLVRGPVHAIIAVMNRFVVAAMLALWSLFATVATIAAPQGPTATVAELQEWFAELRSHADVAVPLPWEYSFSDADSHRLEALSLALVEQGYRILALQRSAPGASARLSVAKLELHSPMTLQRRNRELLALARRHGVAVYDGVDLGAAER
jgi:hypothetical protein